MKATLTDLGLRSLENATKQVKVWDTRTKGFGILVSGSTKTFFVSYGRERRIKTLGHYPDVSLAEARKKAMGFLSTDQPVSATGIKFGEAMEDFIEQHYKNSTGRHKINTRRLLTAHFLLAFEKKSLGSITDKDVSDELNKMSKTPSQQLHAFRAIRTMLRWCTKPPRRYIVQSPLHGYEPPGKDKKGKRTLTDAELVKLWLACEGFFGGLIRLLILWGTRNGETARIRRTWIEDGILTIPGEFTKNSRDHAIPLLPMAREILSEQKGNGDYFFPGRTGEDEHFKDGSWGKMKKELAKKAGVENWQLRDIRRTFRSNMPKLKVSREIAENLINHVTGQKNELDEIYDRYDYIQEKREALQKWEHRISELLARAA